MKIEMNKSDLIAMVMGCTPSYEHMDIPVIRSCGYYTGGFHDKWAWNYHAFVDMSEEQVYDVYKTLKSPAPEKVKSRWEKHPCTMEEFYTKLMELDGVTEVYIQDNNDMSINLNISGGKIEDIQKVIYENVMICIRVKINHREASIIHETVLDAKVAEDMLENPPEANEKLMELLRINQ